MYKRLLRPILFLFDPELIHHISFFIIKIFVNIPGVKYLTKKNFSITSKLLEREVFGIKFPNPVGLAAGFDKNAELFSELSSFGFGFIEIGTVTPQPQPGNKKKRIFRLNKDQSLINRLGFNNKGSENVSSRVKKNKPRGLLGINIGPNKDSINRVEDYIVCFKKFCNLADYITINISSPNTENLRDFHERGELGNLIKTINKEKKNNNSNIPIAVKISPDLTFDQIEGVSEILIENNVEIIIISNSTDKNRDALKNINKLEKGGLSGKPIEKISNNIINRFYKLIGKKIIIIGVGGVDSARGVYEKMTSGATIVQLYTGMVYKGPKIASMINDDLVKILEKDGIKNIREIIGSKKSS